MHRYCSDCLAPIAKRNRTGRCRSCVAVFLNADPVIKAKRIAGMKAHYADPANVAKVAARSRALCANMSDEERERRRQRGCALAPILHAANLSMTKEKRAENGRKRTDTVLAWCPPEWRDKYRELKIRGRRASVAKAMTLHLIAGRPLPRLYDQQRRRLDWCPPERLEDYVKLRKMTSAAEARRMIEAEMTTFERQMAKLRTGGRLVSKPVMRVAEHAYSLTGSSAAML